MALFRPSAAGRDLVALGAGLALLCALAGRPTLAQEAPAPAVADWSASIADESDGAEQSASEADIVQAREPTPFEDRPYDPVGIHWGSFLLFPEIETGVRVTDNVLRSATRPRSDVAAELASSLDVRSNWSRHELSANIRGLLTSFETFDSENDRAFNGDLRGRLDITEDASLTGEAGFDRAQESRSDFDFPAGAIDRPDIDTVRAAFSLDHRFNRLSERVRADISEETHSGVPGLEAENFVERSLSLRLGYEVSPVWIVFAEGALSARDFEAVPASDGIARDSTGHRVVAGVAFEPSPIWHGGFSVGAARETPDDSRLASIEGVIADADITWAPSALTAITLRASSGIDPSVAAGTSGAITHSAELEVRHEFRRHFIAVGGVAWRNADYAGLDVEETEWVSRLGLEYLFNREWALLADVQHTDFASGEPGRDYDENRLRFVIRARR